VSLNNNRCHFIKIGFATLLKILPLFVLIGCEAAVYPNRQDSKAPRFDRYQEFPLNEITPEGWLREFLARQNSGLTGHRENLCYPFDTCLWGGIIPRNSNYGEDWWRYEQSAYLTDGTIRLGYLLDDEKLIKTGREGVTYLLAHPMKDGRLGFPFFTSQWPMAVFFRVMQAEYLATHNPDLLEALHKHYLSYSVNELAHGHRNIVNLEGVLWTYGQTGDHRLLDLAEKVYQTGADEMPLAQDASSEKTSIHGVTYMEEAKIPAILYAYTGKKIYLDVAVNAFKKLDRDDMLPDGVPTSNEALAGRNPYFSHETCDISDYTWSLGYLLMATGDATWADHIEKAIFNAGPGCVSKDFKNFQYFSSVNQVIANGRSNHNKGSVPSAYGTTWMQYRPCHETECCAGNVNRFMPNYAARMWMRDQHGGLAAALYGPSVSTLSINHGGGKLTVTESTSYPFSDTIIFNFATPSSVTMPFSFRIPGWCESPSVRVNGKLYEGPLKPGSFVTLRRAFNNRDKVVLKFPMTAKIVPCGDWGISVERGPLLYAYPVPEQVTVDTNIYSNLRGKISPDPVNFPALDIEPAGSWNYALAAKSADDLKVVETGSTGYPLDPGAAPVVIQVPVMKVKDWTLLENRFTPPLPEQGQFSCEPTLETITLVPYGSTRLRVSVFPVAP
jgi:hypothetical protein